MFGFPLAEDKLTVFLFLVSLKMRTPEETKRSSAPAFCESQRTAGPVPAGLRRERPQALGWRKASLSTPLRG